MDDFTAPVGNTVPPVGTPNYQGTTESGLTTKTEAPTNAGTFEALDAKTKPGLLTQSELTFVTLMDMHWGMHGEFPTAEKAKESYGIPLARFQKLLGTKEVIKALSERGIKTPSSESWKTKGLTPLQLLVANTMLDLIDQRSDKKKLQDLGVDTKTHAAWLRDPVYRDYLHTKANNLINDHHHDAMLAMMDKVRNGDPAMLKLYLEFTGKYAPNKAPELNLNVILTRILEIVIDVVSDPKERDEIADRLMGLGQATQIANAITTEPIALPEVQPARELSPEMQEVLESGAGVNI